MFMLKIYSGMLTVILYAACVLIVGTLGAFIQFIYSTILKRQE